MIKPDSSNEELNPTQPFDNNSEDTSTDTDIDDYKDMMLEMHRFANRQKSMYNWDNLK